MINDDELKDAKLVAAFMKGLGFTRQFRIYYSAADSGTYQGQIRYDILRRRSYIISFGKTNYSLT